MTSIWVISSGHLEEAGGMFITLNPFGSMGFNVSKKKTAKNGHLQW